MPNENRQSNRQQPRVPPSSASSASTTDPPYKKHKKREKVAQACQRCRTRKQKYDGTRPNCASCARLTLKCDYTVPPVPARKGKIYIEALEKRVAELESQLASMAQLNIGNDHLRSARLGASMPFGTQRSQVVHLEPQGAHPDATGEHQPRNPVDLDADMLEGTWAVNGMGNDFTQILSVMTGQQRDMESGAMPGFDMPPGSLDDLQATCGADRYGPSEQPGYDI